MQRACYCLEACLGGGEVFFFYDVGLAAVLEALHVQPGLTGSRDACDELPAYLRALGNKHGVAGRDLKREFFMAFPTPPYRVSLNYTHCCFTVFCGLWLRHT